jgi:hypothetical protein
MSTAYGLAPETRRKTKSDHAAESYSWQPSSILGGRPYKCERASGKRRWKGGELEQQTLTTLALRK